jgi:mono/diheme cytochrome c family protein
VKRLAWSIAAMALLSVLALAQHAYERDPDWQAPEHAAQRQNPLTAEDDIIGGGEKLFLRHCAECHGEDARGRRSAADLTSPVVQGQSDGAIFWRVTNGNSRRRMPSFSRLPEAQRWQLVLYLRSLRKSD